MATSKVNTWECVIPLADEVLPEPSPGFTSTKHGDHDQSEHGNWATGETTGTGTKDDPIRTSDVEAAARALGEGKHVKLSSPDQVATLLDKLNSIAKEAEAAGGKAKNVDLCNVTVPGTNLFCVESKGIPRVEMPQLKGIPTEGTPAAGMEADKRGEVDITQAYLDSLKASGVSMEDGTALASHLKATQNELNGNKVAGIMAAARAGELDIDQPLVVSKDGYIVDGHHRWAAKVALEYDGIDDPQTDMKIPVVRVDQDIIDILESSKKFAAEQGLPQVAVKRFAIVRKHADHDQSEHGNWATGGEAVTIGNRLDQLEKEMDDAASKNDQAAMSRLIMEHKDLVWRAASEGNDALLAPKKSTKHGDHDQSEHGNWATGGGSSNQPMTATEAAVALTEKFGGATLPVEITMDEWAEYEKAIIDGPQPTTGYAVATAVPGVKMPAAEFMDREKGVAAIEKFLTDNIEHFADPKNHLGLWENKNDGMVYLDVTEVVDSKEEAVRLGAARNQIAVWDFEKGDEIPTGGTGEQTKTRSDAHSDARFVKVVARANPTTGRIAVRRSHG